MLHDFNDLSGEKQTELLSEDKVKKIGGFFFVSIEIIELAKFSQFAFFAVF